MLTPVPVRKKAGTVPQEKSKAILVIFNRLIDSARAFMCVRLWHVVDWSTQRDGRSEDTHLRLVADHEAHVAGLVKDLDKTGLVALAHVLVVGLVLRGVGHVFG